MVKARTIGKTFEGRNLKVLEINTANSNDVFWIDAGTDEAKYDRNPSTLMLYQDLKKKPEFPCFFDWWCPLSTGFSSGIHAREWIAPAVATYIVHELVNNYDKHKESVDSYRWYILPVHNPDGYEYSHTHVRTQHTPRPASYITYFKAIYAELIEARKRFIFQYLLFFSNGVNQLQDYRSYEKREYRDASNQSNLRNHSSRILLNM